MTQSRLPIIAIPFLLAAAATAAACGRDGAPDREPITTAETSAACASCHRTIAETQALTAHARTSAEASAETIAGSFADGANTLTTSNPSVSFLMTHRGDGYYQTARDARTGQSRTERMDLVVGSGRRGQTYLFWSNGVLVELPVSYLTSARHWINSPGYQDGQVDFSRVVVPRCLECHATSFRLEVAGTGARYAPDYTVGITCEKCHGDGRRHREYQTANPADSAGRFIANPARMPRERQLDGCALCHAGGLRVIRPPFSYRPGEPLDSFFTVTRDTVVRTPDVHGDQVGLLALSRCFRESGTMTCATCHDVHVTDRDPARLGARCLQCHQPGAHPALANPPADLVAGCVDCHMPTGESRALQFNAPGAGPLLRFRSHLIGVYSGGSAVRPD